MRLPSGLAVKAAGKASADGESCSALAARALPGAARTKASTADNNSRLIINPLPTPFRPQEALTLPRPPEQESRSRHPCRWKVAGSVRRDVLVQAEEVVGVVLSLQRLEAVVLRRAIGLPDPLLPLLPEEVHVDARVEGLERRPQIPNPLALGVEAIFRLGAGGDVEGMPRASCVVGGLVASHPGYRSAELPNREGGKRRADAMRVLDGDVDHLVGELGDVARPVVVPAVVRESGVEHRLVLEEGLGDTEVEH